MLHNNRKNWLQNATAVRAMESGKKTQWRKQNELYGSYS
jgi:hypothetical protein